MPSVRLCSSTSWKPGSSAASACPLRMPHVNFAWLPSIDFSLKLRTTSGFITSTSTVTRGKRRAITSKMRCTSASLRYIVRPSMMTSASPDSRIIPPQSSIADMAICEIFPFSGSSFSRTAMVSGKSRLYQC